MAERRMFAKTIITSDAFLDMPMSARCLYFTLAMFADDEGFVNNPKSIMRQVGATTDDMNVLISKKFVLLFDSGVIVIKHWKIHNYIQSDRLHKTKYKEEKSMLVLDENNAYKMLSDAECIQNVSKMDTECIQDVSKMDTEVRLGKDSLNTTSSICGTDEPYTAYPEIIEAWNKLPLQGIRIIAKGTSRYKLLHARIKQYGEEAVMQAIENIKDSSFLLGQNKTGWTITFDWMIKPNNFPKVLEGNYLNKQPNGEESDFGMTQEEVDRIVEKYGGAGP